MSELRVYRLASNWERDAYDRLLDLALVRGGSCTLALRKQRNASCERWVATQAPRLELARQAEQWPGTIVYSEENSITLLKYRISDGLVSHLRSSVESIFDWISPALPEDLGFLRPDGSPWFISISHERDAFFKLYSTEVPEIEAMFAPMEIAYEHDDNCPEERY